MRIAVIGSGISGLVAAYLLSPEHEITVFEANDYIGGHTHTIDVVIAGKTYAVDTGFIVFNTKTYPNFTRLLRKLDVPWQPSSMSFSLHCKKTGLVFSPSSLNSLFAQRGNLLRPSFYRMILDALRFRRNSLALLDKKDDHITLENYLERHQYSRFFRNNFIIPMGSAIWSSDPYKFRNFPARYFVEFFYNHGILNIRNQPQWLVIKGGSRQYVKPLVRAFKDRIRTNTPIASVRRMSDRVEIMQANGENESFDQVIIATHSDQALAMLSDPSEAERRILGSIPYQENETVLHTDTSVLPPQRSAWASWNYYNPPEKVGRVAVTYDMNILQNLKADVEFCVTLNWPGRLDPAKVYRKLVYHHPIYDPEGLKARKCHAEINGFHRTYFCGAYWGYGFHEDGVNSALEVCRYFGRNLSDF
jgi:uncharacterized protein